MLIGWILRLRVVLGLVAFLGFAWPVTARELLGCLVEPSRIAEVGSPVVGVIERVSFERGDAVSRGKALVQLKADVEQAATGLASARAKAEAEVRGAQANYEFAKRKFDRSLELQQKNFISQQGLEQARAEAEIAEQKLAQARENKRVLSQELSLARAQLAQRTIVSPIDGVVVERYVNTGQRVEQQTIAKIATLDPLRVEVIVPAMHFNKVQLGMAARIQPDLPEVGQQTATVTLVDRVIDTASNSFRVRLELPNPGNALPAGMRCKADLGLTTVAKSTESKAKPQRQDAPTSGSASTNRPARKTETPSKEEIKSAPPASTESAAAAGRLRLSTKLAVSAPRGK